MKSAHNQWAEKNKRVTWYRDGKFSRTSRQNVYECSGYYKHQVGLVRTRNPKRNHMVSRMSDGIGWVSERDTKRG